MTEKGMVWEEWNREEQRGIEKKGEKMRGEVCGVERRWEGVQLVGYESLERKGEEKRGYIFV